MRIGMRGAPPRFRLEHVTPERDLTEDATDGMRLVATACIRQRVDGITGGMEAAVALGTWNRVRTEGQCKRILFTPAMGDHSASVRPYEVVKD